MNLTLEPSVLFITEDGWNDEINREEFLENLLLILGYVNDNDNIKICWNDNFESLLWEYPQKAPWRIDKDYSNPLVPVINKLLKNNIIDLEESLYYSQDCIVEPNGMIGMGDDLYVSTFMSMMHYHVIKLNDLFLAVQPELKSDYKFSCDCHMKAITPKIITEYLDMIDLEVISEELWPKNSDQKDKIIKLVEIFLQKNKCSSLYKYDFTERFVKDIINITIRKSKLINQIVKRLCMNEAQARGDASLQDEYIERQNEYRIRITQRPTSTRVHYIYNRDKIIFVTYYGEGEHNAGLR